MGGLASRKRAIGPSAEAGSQILSELASLVICDQVLSWALEQNVVEEEVQVKVTTLALLRLFLFVIFS